jgi:hypothetical protein
VPDPTFTGADEQRHAPGPEELWGESWYFDFFDRDGTTGGYVRLGLYPNLGVAWYWACLVGEGRPLTIVVDHDVPMPSTGRSLEVRTEGLWADHNVETAFEHMSLGCEAFATALDEPAEAYGSMYGHRVPFGLDLEWETDGDRYPYPGVTRYEVPCSVHGEVLVGDERIELDGWGQRDHSWGVRDWWTAGWMWSSGRLEDGTRFHATHVTYGGAPLYATGYVQGPDGPLGAVAADAIDRSQDLGAEGLPVTGRLQLAELGLTIAPVAFAPVLLAAPDGRISRFPRALCRFTDETTGRRGSGWTEWNQPQA